MSFSWDSMNFVRELIIYLRRFLRSNAKCPILGSSLSARTRLRKRYESWIENHLADVVFTGMVSCEDQPRYYRTADVFCAPATSRESFGLVLLEAMATGRPIVATNIEGFASVVTNGEEGLLVPPMNHRALANTLLILLKDKQKRLQMGQKGIVTASKYSWEDVSRRVLDYYGKILEKVRQQRTRGDMANLQSVRKSFARYFTDPIVTLLEKTHVTPNTVTITGTLSLDSRSRTGSFRPCVCSWIRGAFCRLVRYAGWRPCPAYQPGHAFRGRA